MNSNTTKASSWLNKGMPLLSLLLCIILCVNTVYIYMKNKQLKTQLDTFQKKYLIEHYNRKKWEHLYFKSKQLKKLNNKQFRKEMKQIKKLRLKNYNIYRLNNMHYEQTKNINNQTK